MSNTVALVVDHSQSTRKYICAILQEELKFSEIHEAENAQEALRLLDANQSVKWIFSSWEMPGMSSRDFLGDLRKRNAHVVLVTGEEEITAREIAIREHVADYLCKPFSPAQLVQKVRRLTGLKERRATERYKASMPCEVDLGFDPFHVYSAELVDISLGGCRVQTSELAPNTGLLDDLATITFLPEGRDPLRLHAQIRRVENGECRINEPGCVRVAFEFIHNEPEQKAILGHYIELCKADAASLL